MQEDKPSRALVIINRRSRAGERDVTGALEHLRQRDFLLTLIATDQPGNISDDIRRQADGVEAVIVGGGDGTLNAAVPALLETGLPLGILPLGTANDLAHTLGIPTSLSEAAGVIAHGVTRLIDIGVVNSVYYFNVASMGLSARVAAGVKDSAKRRYGVPAYLPNLLAAIRENRAFTASITCDEQIVHLLSIQIAIGNGPHYGGGLTIGEGATIDDGELYVYSLAPQSLWQLLRHAPRLYRGRHGNDSRATVMRGREIRVETEPPMPIDTDGEVRTSTPATFRVLPRAVRVFAPWQGTSHGA